MTTSFDVGAGCRQSPAQPATPFQPAYVDVRRTEGWDAGAHSEAQLDNDVRLAFTVNFSQAIVCGLTPASTAPSTGPARATHAFYVTRINGVLTARAYELGRVVAGPWPVTGGDTLEVIRFGGKVLYRKNNALLFTSRTPSTGVVKVAGSMYGPEDFIG